MDPLSPDSPPLSGSGLVLLGVVLLCSGVVSTAQAQHLDNGFYGKIGAGLSGYTGDLSASTAGAPQDGTHDANVLRYFPLLANGEVGYQFSPNWGLALGVQAGSYLSVGDAAPGADSYRRYSPHLLGRYTFGPPEQRFSFYLDGGLNATVGGPSHTGIGPSVGGGIDIRASRSVSLYVESRLNMSFPDDAVDGAGPTLACAGGGGCFDDGGRPFDTVNQVVGFGLKFSLTTPTAPEIISLTAPAEVQAGTPVTVTATVNEDEAARPLDRRWRLGDGTEGSGRTVTHTYSRPGTYTVSFSVQNEAGEATESTTIRVTRAESSSSPDAPWVVSLSASPNPVPVGEPVQLRSRVEGDGPVTYQWTIGDDTVETRPEPTYTFDRAGRYTVQVRASNEAGMDARSMTVHAERRATQEARRSDQPSGTWTIGVASMRNRDGATRMARRYRDRLGDAPMSVRIVEAERDGERYHRVVAGTYETAEAAQRVLNEYQRVLPPGAWVVQLR